MMHFIPQCKGKDITDLASSAMPKPGDLVYNSIKYDGNYIQVVIDKDVNEVQFFTSGGKEFYVKEYADDFLKLSNYFGCCPVVRFETEWIGDTEGLLGDREKSQGIITTWRTEFNKGIKSKALKNGKFKVFDYMSLEPFAQRATTLNKIASNRVALGLFTDCISIVEHDLVVFSYARDINKQYTKLGYEGGYIKLPKHTQNAGKRVNTAIKDKPRPTYDLLCIGVTEGEGKYEGLIGSLILKDSKDRVVNVGSGLKDNDRAEPMYYYTGKVIEIEAERRNDSTYIQPVYIGIRLDKTVKDIS